MAMPPRLRPSLRLVAGAAAATSLLLTRPCSGNGADTPLAHAKGVSSSSCSYFVNCDSVEACSSLNTQVERQRQEAEDNTAQFLKQAAADAIAARQARAKLGQMGPDLHSLHEKLANITATTAELNGSVAVARRHEATAAAARKKASRAAAVAGEEADAAGRKAKAAAEKRSAAIGRAEAEEAHAEVEEARLDVARDALAHVQSASLGPAGPTAAPEAPPRRRKTSFQHSVDLLGAWFQLEYPPRQYFAASVSFAVGLAGLLPGARAQADVCWALLVVVAPVVIGLRVAYDACGLLDPETTIFVPIGLMAAVSVTLAFAVGKSSRASNIILGAWIGKSAGCMVPTLSLWVFWRAELVRGLFLIAGVAFGDCFQVLSGGGPNHSVVKSWLPGTSKVLSGFIGDSEVEFRIFLCASSVVSLCGLLLASSCGFCLRCIFWGPLGAEGLKWCTSLWGALGEADVGPDVQISSAISGVVWLLVAAGGAWWLSRQFLGHRREDEEADDYWEQYMEAQEAHLLEHLDADDVEPTIRDVALLLSHTAAVLEKLDEKLDGKPPS